VCVVADRHGQFWQILNFHNYLSLTGESPCCEQLSKYIAHPATDELVRTEPGLRVPAAAAEEATRLKILRAETNSSVLAFILGLAVSFRLDNLFRIGFLLHEFFWYADRQPGMNERQPIFQRFGSASRCGGFRVSSQCLARLRMEYRRYGKREKARAICLGYRGCALG